MAGKGTGGDGSKPTSKQSEPSVNAELRALYKQYGEEGGIPEHLLDLANQIEQAHGAPSDKVEEGAAPQAADGAGGSGKTEG